MKKELTPRDWITATQRSVERARIAFIEVLDFNDRAPKQDICAEQVDKLLMYVSDVLEDFKDYKEKQV